MNFRREILWPQIESDGSTKRSSGSWQCSSRTVKDPRVHGLVSITHVETTPDLRYAKVYVSVLDKSDVKEVIKGLKSAGGYLRRELGRALSLRYTPELVFQADDSIDKGTHILKLLNDIERKETGGDQ